MIAELALAAIIYVDGAHGRAQGTGSQKDPVQTIYQASWLAKPGDTINVLPTAIYYNQGIQVSGTLEHPIRVTGGGKAHLGNAGGKPSFLILGARYVTVDGFTITGANNPQSCVSIAPTASSSIPHHITIQNNQVSGCGGNGISAFQSDYISIIGNYVTASAFNTYGTWTGVGPASATYASGISILASVDTDGNTTSPKMVISGNIVWNNTNTPACARTDIACLSTWNDPDGSGIMMDANSIPYMYRKGLYPNAYQPPYHGLTLIANNLSFNNGGKGIAVYRTSYVRVEGNTLYGNNQDPYNRSIWTPGELGIGQSGDVSAYGNIFRTKPYRTATGAIKACVSIRGGSGYSATFQNPYTGSHDGAGPLTLTGNSCYQDGDATGTSPIFQMDGVSGLTVTGGLYGPPFLVRPGVDLTADFRPTPASPISHVWKAGPYAPVIDLLGQMRNGGAVGAYSR